MRQRHSRAIGVVAAVVLALVTVAGSAGCSSSDGNGGPGDIGVLDAGADDVQRTDAGEVTVPRCTTNADCIGVFGDIGPCRVAVCGVDGTCENAAKKDYVSCEDGDVCTQGSFCVAGECTGGRDVVCNDGNDCTTDRCDPVQGCVNEPQTGGACDDGDPCTAADSCQQGQCQGTPSDTCPCTADADCAAFEDGDLCNGTLACVEGRCRVDPDTRVVCDTSGDTACRATVCVPETGACAAEDAPGGTACDDGNACTADDTCASGECVGGENLCACERDGDCDEYEDGDRCNGTLACVGGGCVVDPETVVTCQQPANPCQQATCQPATGACQTRPRSDGTACSDGNACTTADRCQAGTCAGTQRACDDGNACTADACNAETGQCTHTATVCDDDDPCTTDSCNEDTGACEHVALFCEQPDDPCLAAVCDSETGGCVTEPRAEGEICDDGNDCTVGETCQSGVCEGPALTCDDGNACTTDTCDPDTGCVYTPIVCPPDDDPCTIEQCDAATGGCAAVPAADGTPCALDGDACAACVAGVCQGAGRCNDEDPCTLDSCNPTTLDCVHTPRDCDDGVACTVDSCDAASGECLHDASGCPTTEDCDNGADDDGDGLTDCADTEDCAGDPACPPPCLPDALEEDDTQDGATAVVPDQQWMDLTSASEDDDWFAIPVCAGGELTLTATFLSASGDIDLYLWTEDGTNPARGVESGDNESFTWTATFDGTIWLQVEMYDDDACNTYDLSITFDDTGCGGGVEDCFDQVDNDGDGRADCADPECSGVVTTPGACTNGADLRIVAEVDVNAVGTACILGGGGEPGCLDDVACNTACIQEQTGLSEDCAGCGGALAACVVTQCIGACLADPASEGCADCIETSCFPAYVACFGVLHCDFEYACDDAADDDGDGLTDCADPDCAGLPACVTPELCDNDLDDDGDELIDCEDVDCVEHPACVPPPPEACDNDVDDDGDGDTDCADLDCAADPACQTGPEDCFDQVDNDGDGLADCVDPDCSAAVAVEGACTNAADLFIAGRVDVTALGQACIVDEGCFADVACNTACIQEATGLGAECAGCGGALAACVVTSCLAPCTADAGSAECASCIETSCYPDYVACFGLLHCAFEFDCENGVSDDEDALVDCADPDCAPEPACQACTDDGREENDSAAAATVAVPTAFFDDLVSAAGDEDWFAVEVCPRGLLVGRAVYDTTAGGVLLDIVTADGTVLAPSVGLNNGRRAAWTSDREGTVYVRVGQPAVSACLTYDLGITLDRTNCPAPPAEDCDDGVDNDRDGATDCDDADCAADPACQPAGEDCFNASDDDGDGRADCRDPDCSGSVAVEGACTNAADLPIAARIDVTALGQTCILDENCLADVACNTACIQERTGLSTGCATCGGELAACVVTSCFIACAAPDSPACAQCIEESCWPGYVSCFGLLHCTLEGACGDGLDDDDDGLLDCLDPDCATDPICTGACVDDPMEDDDTMAAAHLQVAPFTISGLVSGWLDDDWFEIPVCEGAVLTIDARFLDANGDIDLYLLDAAENGLAESISGTDDEHIEWTATFAGRVFLQVNMWDEGACNTYDLAVGYDTTGCTGVRPELCDDAVDNDEDGDTDCFDADCEGHPACGAASCGDEDGLEPNDELAGAVILGDFASFEDLVVTLGDDDWFRVPVCDGGELDITAWFFHILGDVDLELTDAAGGVIRSSRTTDDNEGILWQSDRDGFVYVRVAFAADPTIGTTCNLYDLDVLFDGTGCAVAVEDCFDDVDNDGDGRADCDDPDCSMTVAEPGNCTNPTDLRAIAGVDIAAVALECILDRGCFLNEACNTACIAELTGVSTTCAECGGAAAVCAISFCALECGNDSGSVACQTCLDTNCWPAYTDCFGVLNCLFEEDCADGVDDEADGLIDCADPDCAGVAPCP